MRLLFVAVPAISGVALFGSWTAWVISIIPSCAKRVPAAIGENVTWREELVPVPRQLLAVT